MSWLFNSSRLRPQLLIGDQGAALWYRRKLHVLPSQPAEAMPLLTSVIRSPRQIIDIACETHQMQCEHVRLPKLSPLDRHLLLQRRAQNLCLEPLASTHTTLGRSEDGFDALIAALPNHGPVATWLEWLDNKGIRIGRCTLLPLELAAMARALNQETSRYTPWHFFIFTTHTGGMRQIVYRNQQPMLVRTLPFDPKLSDTQKFAERARQGITALTEYLPRFGFTSLADSTITLIGPQDLTQYMQPLRAACESVLLFTPTEAAKKLRLHHRAISDETACDGVMLQWLGRQPRVQLPVKFADFAEEQDNAQPARDLALGKVAWGFATAVALMIAILTGSTYYHAVQFNAARQKYAALQKETVPANVPVPWNMVLENCGTPDCLKDVFGTQPKPWSELRTLARIAAPSFKIEDFNWRTDTKEQKRVADVKLSPLQYSHDPVMATQRLQNLVAALSMDLPLADIRATDLPVAVDPAQPMVSMAGKSPDKLASITITLPLAEHTP